MTAEPPGGWDRTIPERPPGRGDPAGWWRRAGAAGVDIIAVSIPALLLGALFLGGIGAAFEADEGLGFFSLILGFLTYLALLLAIAILYAPMLMRRPGEHNGQTWGKQLFGIRVITATGAPIGFGTAAIREVVIKGLALGVASAIIPLIPYLLDVLWPLWDSENRALHDFPQNTRVVRAERLPL